MIVLHVVTKSELGGAQTHVWQLATCMLAQGHVVHICAFPGGWLEEQARLNGIRFHPNVALSNSLDPLQGLRAGRNAARVVAEIGPDVIHCHSSAAGFWTRIAIRGARPTIFTAHGWGFTPGAPWLRRAALLVAEWLVAPYTARYICVSEYDRRLALKYGVGGPTKVAVIHNGVEECERGSSASDPETPIRVMFVGRLASPKEPELLLAALLELPEHVQSAYEVCIVGDGPLLPRLRESMARRGAKVRFTGALDREEVLRLLSESHVFVLTSRYEGFPVSILEAMSMGLAVIASDVGGIREAVTQDSGILIGRSDKDGLKRALVRLAEDRDAIARYGAVARARAKTEFSVTTMCERTLAVYESVGVQ